MGSWRVRHDLATEQTTPTTSVEYNISKRESENLKSLHPPSFCITRIFRTIDFHCKTGFTFRYLETPAGKTHLPLFLEVNFFFFFCSVLKGFLINWMEIIWKMRWKQWFSSKMLSQLHLCSVASCVAAPGSSIYWPPAWKWLNCLLVSRLRSFAYTHPPCQFIRLEHCLFGEAGFLCQHLTALLSLCRFHSLHSFPKLLDPVADHSR